MFHDTDEKSSQSEEICIIPKLYTFTKQKLMEHFGPLLNEKVIRIMENEIDRLNYPTAQTMMDIYHQSGAKSWSQFVKNSPLCYLRQNQPETFTLLENYQCEFTENIFAPLSQYLSSHEVFKGVANDFIQRVFAIYNNIKLLKIAPKCCMQIDIRSKHDIFACTHNQRDDEKLEWDPDDEQIYEADSDENTITDELGSSRPNATQFSVSDILRMQKGINQIMKHCIIPSNGDSYCYKRYEILLSGTEVESFQAASNNTIPQCAFENAPLCMIFNSTASAGQIFSKLCTKRQRLITVSFHAYYDKLSVYLYITDDKGKSFGSRIFGDDLLTTIRLLFEDTRVDMAIMNEINNYLQFKPNASYQEFYPFLMRHCMNQNEINLEQKSSIDDAFEYNLDPLVASKLEEIVNATDVAGNKHIMRAMKKCFIQHDINCVYFKTHTRKDFVRLLRDYKIKVSVAIKLWKAFTKKASQCNAEQFINENNGGALMRYIGDHQSREIVDPIYNYDENEAKASSPTDIQMLLKKVQLLEQENAHLKQENAVLTRIIRLSEDATSDSDPSSDEATDVEYNDNELYNHANMLIAMNDGIQLRQNRIKTWHVCLIALVIVTWFINRIC